MYRGRQYINCGYLQNTCNTYCINHSILRCLMTYPAVHPFVHTPIHLSVLSIIHLLYAAVPRYVMIRNPNHEVLERIKTIKLQPVITPTTDTWNFMVILGKENCQPNKSQLSLSNSDPCLPWSHTGRSLLAAIFLWRETLRIFAVLTTTGTKTKTQHIIYTSGLFYASNQCHKQQPVNFGLVSWFKWYHIWYIIHIPYDVIASVEH